MQLLEPNIQNYHWGSQSFLSALQGRAPTQDPEAELWMSAHPKSPSRILNSEETLKEIIDKAPNETLGPRAKDFHNELPYIMKILAIETPLSLQVHPSEEQAEAGYKRETQSDQPHNDLELSYSSPRGKEEIVCALTEFHTKFGFRDIETIRKILSISDEPEFVEIRKTLTRETLEEDKITDAVSQILAYDSQQIQRMTQVIIDAWDITTGMSETEMQYFAQLAEMYPSDPGVVISVLLNFVTLNPGEALYVPPGMVHVYLKGNAVEITSNSDNVLRCGLTTKHIDTEEFLSVANFTPQSPIIQDPESSNHSYESPTEFTLSRLAVDTEWETSLTGPEMLISTQGSFRIRDLKGETIYVDQGAAVWVPFSDGGYSISGQALIFRCSVI